MYRTKIYVASKSSSKEVQSSSSVKEVKAKLQTKEQVPKDLTCLEFKGEETKEEKLDRYLKKRANRTRSALHITQPKNGIVTHLKEKWSNRASPATFHADVYHSKQMKEKEQDWMGGENLSIEEQIKRKEKRDKEISETAMNDEGTTTTIMGRLNGPRKIRKDEGEDGDLETRYTPFTSTMEEYDVDTNEKISKSKQKFLHNGQLLLYNNPTNVTPNMEDDEFFDSDPRTTNNRISSSFCRFPLQNKTTNMSLDCILQDMSRTFSVKK
jgi:hypothetical protein